MTLISLAAVPMLPADPDALASAIAEMAESVRALGPTAEGLGEQWRRLPHVYDTPESSQLTYRFHPAREAAVDLVETMQSMAGALDDLAVSLAVAKHRLEQLRAEVPLLRARAAEHRAELQDLYDVPVNSDALSPSLTMWNDRLISEAVSIRAIIEDAVDRCESALRRIGPAPTVPSANLTSGLMGNSSTEVRTHDEFANALAMTVLARLSASGGADAARLLGQHPDWITLMRGFPPSPVQVNRWWLDLDSSSQAALIGGAAAVIGSLGGVPPLARVTANRVNAARRREWVSARLADLEQRAPSGGFSTPRIDYQDEITMLRAELKYLTRVEDGRVQLYLYEPGTQSIIEMIGTPRESTERVVTYAPGTFTSVKSFFDGNVQQVGRWLSANDENTVVFVWKEGSFPGENPTTGEMDLLRIGEANDESRALYSGTLLASFQDEMRTSSPNLDSATQVGSGHSWGLAGITASEVQGARYDQVHSLAGAGMPSAWHASEDTEYFHWAYTDALTMAQETGIVWDGKIPANDPAFESTVYPREGDFTLYLPGQSSPLGYPLAPPAPAPTMPATTTPLENHNLIAGDSQENQRALGEILKKVRQ